jgi:hypothetical protein
MTHAIRLSVLICLPCWLAAPAYAQSCGPVHGLEFVCGPKNAEDLVRVPGTPWIIASGMAAGASLTLIDSRDGTYSGLHGKLSTMRRSLTVRHRRIHPKPSRMD